MSTCSTERATILTVATSPAYLESAAALAVTVHTHIPRMACIHVAMPASLSAALHSPLLMPVALQPWASHWLPEQHFCTTRMSGWRQTHVLKTQALLSLLSRGLDVLLLDADRRLLGNPLPALQASGVDVAGMRDEALLNLGLVYMRASARMLSFAQRVVNRSLHAWDQAIFNEEISAARSISCCYTNRWIKQCVEIVESMHRLNKDSDVAAVTQRQQTIECRTTRGRGDGVGTGGQTRRPSHGEGTDGVAPTAPTETLRPPTNPAARMFRSWDPVGYNELPLGARKYNRCTRTACPRSPAANGLPSPHVAQARLSARSQHDERLPLGAPVQAIERTLQSLDNRSTRSREEPLTCMAGGSAIRESCYVLSLQRDASSRLRKGQLS